MEDGSNSNNGEDAGSYEETTGPVRRQNNTLPLFGNKETMNINHMIITNILQSRYFKTDLYELKTFHEVVDEIFYRVSHLEPWEKNSRKLAGQVGMCAGVRGVAAGGIVSTPFCLLYKLFTLKLTRKQVKVMLNHYDSPYIRGLGFMYIRYCQPPGDFLTWFAPYFDDEEEIDLKAGGGFTVTIGQMCRMMLVKMEWFGTMFPRISVNVQKEIQERVRAIERTSKSVTAEVEADSNDSKRKPSSLSPANGQNDDSHKNRSRSGERRKERSNSLSPRRQSRSPRRRSRSPRKQSRSPRRRSRSPKRRSPRRRSRSPRKRSRSPRKRSRSPRKRSRSPRKQSRSPRKRSRSPRKHSLSPRRRSRSPRKRSRSPRKRSRSPRKRSRSPRKRSRSPRKRSRSPRKWSRSPRKRSRSPRKRSRSPRKRSRSPRKRSRSPKGSRSGSKDRNIS